MDALPQGSVAKCKGSDQAQDPVGFLGCERTLMAHIQFFIHQYPQVLLSRAALNPLISQPVSMPGIALIQSINHNTQLGVILKLAEVALNPTVHVPYKDAK
ncbi:hypothetical protein QYF61_023895 [Mycteria americana]|uniref:Uncharacterized protein n=1 Tax=Mycteria americana TaxID=33587 RepID=A0AAN7NRW1_MYCAM|nr:hypothetical protein QYF61_023895 [Mycteria americana]